MDRALLDLLVMRMRGGIRQRVKQLFSLRGALLFLVLGGIFWLLVTNGKPAQDPQMFNLVDLDSQPLRDSISTFLPLSLLGMTLLTVLLTTGPSFHFSPAEINLLFVGPFSRRSLILYKFIAYATGAALSAAIITPFSHSQTGNSLAVFIAAFLTLVFVQLNSAAAGMAWQAFEGNRMARLKWPAMMALCASALAALLYAWADPDMTVFDLMTAVRHSWIGSIILLPYIAYAELFLARGDLAQTAFWGAIAVLMNAALLWVVIKLDGRTFERSLRESAKMSDRWERMKQGGSFWATEKTEIPSIRRAPALGGLGPIAWRQAIKAVRNSAKSIAVFLVAAAFAGPFAYLIGISLTDDRAVVTILFFFAFIVPRTLVCDFRGELSRMETYKALPIPPWRICAGQLVVQVLLAYGLTVTMIASAACFEQQLSPSLALMLAAFALPLTLLVYAVENTAFLLFPAKLIPMGRADFEFLGRTLVEFITKMIIVVLGVALAVVAASFTAALLKTTGLIPLVASWLTLALIGVLATVMMQWAFRRFVVAEAFD